MHISVDKTQYYAYAANHQAQAERETVVFVHGAAMNHGVWMEQSRYFAYHGYNVAALDLPGHHLSGGDLRRDISELGGWLCAILGKLTGSGLHLVGHSMGALIALEGAAQCASKIPLRSLALLGFSYPMTVAPQLLEAAENAPSEAYAMMTKWSYVSKIGGQPTPGVWSPGLQMSMLENSRPGAVFADLSACNAYQGGEDALAKVAARGIPLLFLCGELDKMAPAKLARRHAENHANAELTLLPNCGHSLLAESPLGVRGALNAFFARASQS